MSRDEKRGAEHDAAEHEVAAVIEIVGAEVLAHTAEHVVGGSAGHAIGSFITAASLCNTLKSSHHETRDPKPPARSPNFEHKEPTTVEEAKKMVAAQAASGICTQRVRPVSREVTIGPAKEPSKAVKSQQPASKKVVKTGPATSLKSSASTAPKATTFQPRSSVSRTESGGVSASTSNSDGTATTTIAAAAGAIALTFTYTLPFSCTIS